MEYLIFLLFSILVLLAAKYIKSFRYYVLTQSALLALFFGVYLKYDYFDSIDKVLFFCAIIYMMIIRRLKCPEILAVLMSSIVVGQSDLTFDLILLYMFFIGTKKIRARINIILLGFILIALMKNEPSMFGVYFIAILCGGLLYIYASSIKEFMLKSKEYDPLFFILSVTVMLNKLRLFLPSEYVFIEMFFVLYFLGLLSFFQRKQEFARYHGLFGLFCIAMFSGDIFILIFILILLGVEIRYRKNLMFSEKPIRYVVKAETCLYLTTIFFAMYWSEKNVVLAISLFSFLLIPLWQYFSVTRKHNSGQGYLVC